MKKRHWAWDVPTDEFYPLGAAKLEILINYIRISQWYDETKDEMGDVNKIILDVTRDLRYASQLWTAFKSEILKMIERDEAIERNQNAIKQKQKSKKIPMPSKVEEKRSGEIINFTEFKKRRSG